MIYSDRTLSQKLERTEARANVDFVETRVRLFPESEATWIEVAGTYAMFDGVESPLTQTFGLGVFEDATAEHLDELEAFFRERRAPIFHEVSPMGDQSLLALLSERGYRPIELTSVMFRELDKEGGGRLKAALKAQLKTRVIDESEVDLWAQTAATGWSTEHESLTEFMLAFGKIAARTSGCHPFIAELNGRPIATGGFQIYDDVCVLSGASTVPEARRQGAQNALLAARLDFARRRGCCLAMMCALPGGQSQKNAQKNGFQTAYTRTKWHLFV
ncbi:MAG: GNAT family N-acetyltransferase [Acidobacteriota bacterium]